MLPTYTDPQSSFDTPAPDDTFEGVASFSADPDLLLGLDDELVWDLHYTFGPEGLEVQDVTGPDGAPLTDAEVEAYADHYPEYEREMAEVCLADFALANPEAAAAA